MFERGEELQINHRSARFWLALGVSIVAGIAAVPQTQALSAPVLPAPELSVIEIVASDVVPPLSEVLLGLAPGLHAEALELALRAAENAAQQGLVTRRDLLAVIDYSLPSTEPRLFVFDLERRALLFCELVAHGKNSGENLTTRFSNEHESLTTSLGLFVTEGTYIGGNGYSLRLNGLEKGFNDQAMSRAIVMHGAPYVSKSAAKTMGRIGRSWGCPAVSPDVARKIIDTLKNGSPVFAYYPDPNWLRDSKFLHG